MYNVTAQGNKTNGIISKTKIDHLEGTKIESILLLHFRTQ